jgi:protoporphyrin/coproporphyrin ferrochelatase
VAHIHDDGVERAVGLVLAPHYSRLSVGTYIERVKAALDESREGLFTFIKSWHDHPRFIEILAARVEEALGELTPEERDKAVVVFTAHSLPAKVIEEGDPYPSQLQETADLVAKVVGLPLYRTGWQSAGRTPEPWLGPGLGAVIGEEVRSGRSAIVVCACGFVADHLEILYDLDIEAQKQAKESDIRLVRTRSMNDDPRFISALGDVVREHLAEKVARS